MFHICAQAQYLVRFGAFSPRPQHNTIWKNIDMYICVYSYRERCFFLGWMFLHHHLQHIKIFVFFCFWKVVVPKPNDNRCFLVVFRMILVLTIYKSNATLIFCGSETRLVFPMFFVLECTPPSLGGAFKCFKWAPFGYFSNWFFESPKIDFGELGPKGSKGHVFFWFWKVVVFKASETFVFEFWLVWVIRTYQAFAWVSSFCC